MKTLVEVKICTIMVIIASLCTGALFSGCGGDSFWSDVIDEYAAPEIPRMATLEAWEDNVGPVSNHCWESMKDADIFVVDGFHEHCLGSGKVIGCYIPASAVDLPHDIILLYHDRTDAQKMDTLSHEFIHLLMWCELGIVDFNHGDSRMWGKTKNGTVEHEARRYIDKMRETMEGL